MQPARIRSEVLLQISSETDVVSARDRARELAGGIGLSPADSAIVATAVSELARNVVAYATRGEVIFRVIEAEHARGLEIVAVDEGRASRTSSSRCRRVLDGSRARPRVARRPRLMDHFHIASKLNKGTTVTIRKWRR